MMPGMNGSIVLTTIALGLACLAAAGCATPAPPTPSATPTVTPTATIPPTATPTPTPPPQVRLEAGDRALFYGDWDRAFEEYSAARQNATEVDQAALGAFGYARTLLESGRVWEAVEAFSAFLSAYPAHPRLAQAHYLKGLAEERAGLTNEAISDYARYLELRPGRIDAHVEERIGDLLRQVARPADALIHYGRAAESGSLADPMALSIKIGQAYLEGGDPGAALQHFDSLLQVATDDATRATLLFLSGVALENQGDPASAYGRYQQSIDSYPTAYDSYSGLVRLVDAGAEVNELQRGIVDFHAGAHEPALRALDRALAGGLSAEGFYYRGLTRRALGESSGALADFTRVVEDYPADPLWAASVLEKARTEWAYLGMYRQAIDTFLAYTATLPRDPKAPEALFLAARTAERVDDLALAADLWLRLPAEYPATIEARDGAFLAGISRYRLGDQAGARAAFELAESLAADSGETARARFWIGKTYAAQGADDAARQAWESAAAADPTGYYSVRATQVLEGRAPFEPESVPSFSVDRELERAEAEAWLRRTFTIDGPEPLSALSPDLAADPRLIRGLEFWDLGQFGLAKQEFNSLRASLESDPEGLYRLMHTMLDLGLYQPAIFAARQILNLAGMDDAATMTAPEYFNHIRFGTYFGDLVLSEAAAFGIDGALLLSLVRQESLFEGFATSYAAARGLTQVIPSTGQNIAEQLGWPPDYTEEDLYRPQVSVRFGTYYLSRQLERYDGDPYAALAAYNAGPGNADIWKEAAPDDPDLFLEVVRLTQPQQYIRSIQEVYDIYQRIYAPGE
jgi:soluble lytic murein transglycosylase